MTGLALANKSLAQLRAAGGPRLVAGGLLRRAAHPPWSFGVTSMPFTLVQLAREQMVAMADSRIPTGVTSAINEDAGPGHAVKTLLRFALCLAFSIFLTGCWSYVSPGAQSRFEMQRAGFSVTVYPVNISRQGQGTAADFPLGRELADWLNARHIADARFSQPGVPVRVEWHTNQAKMAEHSAKSFGAWVQQTGVTTDYALLAEILCNGDETKVIGIHYYLAEKSGLLAAGGLTNSHWDEFKRINPTDRFGGLAVLKEMLGKRMPAPGQP